MCNFLFVIPDTNIVSWNSKGCPGDVEPAIAGEELVGVGVGAEEGYEALELRGVLGADVSGLARQVLGTIDTADQTIDAGVAETGIDDDGTDDAAGGLQQVQTTVFHVCNLSYGWDVVRVFAKV